ncbi:MAG: hypothetical protein ACJ8F7_11865 [Gemmataceae bacterium]
MTATQPVPPPNTFWKQYSPNGEAVLSPLASTLIHAGFLALLLLGLAGLLRPPENAIPIEPIRLGGPGEEGLGGQRQGVGNNPGNLSRQDAVESLQDRQVVRSNDSSQDPAVRPVAPPTITEENGDVIRPQKARRQNANVGTVVPVALPGVPANGLPGPGAGVAQGPGTGGRRSARVERAARWEMIFRTTNHADYLRQLSALGAYVGVADEHGRLMIIKNLSERPAKWEYESVRDMNRVWWTDDRAESARGVAELLQLNVVPSEFFAFIPQSVEDQLFKAEMDHARTWGVTDEHKIKATQFIVKFRAGKPVFTVKSQTRE